MGVNLRDVRQVIHYGPSRQVDDFVQEMGRAGRDGKPAKSLLFFTGHQLKTCEDTMKLYANGNDCLHKVLLAKFGATASSTNVAHDCCVICHAACKCLGTVVKWNYQSTSQFILLPPICRGIRHEVLSNTRRKNVRNF